MTITVPISILDSAVRRIKDRLKTMRELGEPMWKQVYEKGDVITVEALPIVTVHVGDERVATVGTSSKYFISCPISFEVHFKRPTGDCPAPPGERHRHLLARLQVEFGTRSSDKGDVTLQSPGVTDILYEGSGSRMEPVDSEDLPDIFRFFAEFNMDYRQSLTDPTQST